ncbi:MAG TPA: AbrB/MazE/SpoVT family DNA-binding domain-containing protein [Thermomicrobiaceae bacterium]|nr:AbrB/MazE/SpoVT family DNA-binding domain-containing protein [Thermomicrobiaceae bacterium]
MDTRTKVAAGGRIVIPAAARRAAGLDVGDEVIVRVEDGEIRIMSLEHAISRAQAIVRRYIPADRSLVDELIAERRAESTRE